MDYTIRLIPIFNPEKWMIDEKTKHFFKRLDEGELVLLIDDGIPNIAPLLTTLKGYDKKQPWEFIGGNAVFLWAPKIEWKGRNKTIIPRIKDASENINEFGRIIYVPDRLYKGIEAVDALKNETGPQMKEFRIYAELIKRGELSEIKWNYITKTLSFTPA